MVGLRNQNDVATFHLLIVNEEMVIVIMTMNNIVWDEVYSFKLPYFFRAEMLSMRVSRVFVFSWDVEN